MTTEHCPECGGPVERRETHSKSDMKRLEALGAAFCALPDSLAKISEQSNQAERDNYGASGHYVRAEIWASACTRLFNGCAACGRSPMLTVEDATKTAAKIARLTRVQTFTDAVEEVEKLTVSGHYPKLGTQRNYESGFSAAKEALAVRLRKLAESA